MELLNLKSAYSWANTLYDVNISEHDFEEIALTAWEMIGTKHTRLYRYITDTENKEIHLPCNCSIIESVTIPVADAQLSSPSDPMIAENAMIEHWIDTAPTLDNPYYQRGVFLKYKQLGNTLLFAKNFKNVCIIYHGVECDNDGLPLINDKEMRAIAAYVAYASIYKEGLKKKDGNILQLASVINQEWLKFCNAARIPSHLSQNDMDSILDAKLSWGRKTYGKSYKSIR